jgi:hypothetical protein
LGTNLLATSGKNAIEFKDILFLILRGCACFGFQRKTHQAFFGQ